MQSRWSTRRDTVSDVFQSFCAFLYLLALPPSTNAGLFSVVAISAVVSALICIWAMCSLLCSHAPPGFLLNRRDLRTGPLNCITAAGRGSFRLNNASPFRERSCRASIRGGGWACSASPRSTLSASLQQFAQAPDVIGNAGGKLKRSPGIERFRAVTRRRGAKLRAASRSLAQALTCGCPVMGAEPNS